MGALDAFLWGCAGGAGAALFVFLVPPLVRASTDGEVYLTRAHAAAIATLVTVLSLLAGIVALIPETVDRGGAIGLGLASQTTLKALVSTVREMLPGP